VILPSFVCSALLHAINYVGATPVFAEIDPKNYNLDPDNVKRRLTKRTKAIIVPHMFGCAADIKQLSLLEVPILEDCAQAIGTTFDNRIVGTFGDAAVFSFYATKVMTTGEGGMVVSRSKKFINRIKELREYDKKGTYHIRFNYKMTDIQAAMGVSQLNRVDNFIRKRRSLAKSYDRAFKAMGISIPVKDPGHIYYR